MFEQSTEVSINIKIQIKLASGTEDHALVPGTLQVSDDGLDCCGMRLLWIGGETSHLTDREGNIASSVGGEVK